MIQRTRKDDWMDFKKAREKTYRINKRLLYLPGIAVGVQKVKNM